MPDSRVTPPWGLAYDERDLDALLSGQTGSTPAALRPVERTLAALRAPATGPELSDEAVARAAFRAFAPARQATTGPNAAVTSHTLVLPPADGRPRRSARHRHRRPAARSARKPRIAVTGAAAAALVVVAVVAGALTGSIGELTSFGRQPASASASARATGQSPGSEGTLVTGAASDRPQSPTPTASAAPTTPRVTSGPGPLCRQYFADAAHPGPGGQAAIASLHAQLSRLAGGPGWPMIYGFCFRYLPEPFDGRSAVPSSGAPAADSGQTPQAATGSASSGGGSQGNQPSGASGQAQGSGAGSGTATP